MPNAQDVLAKKTGDVATIREKATVTEAAKIMSNRRIGSLVVCRRKKVVGIFTEPENRLIGMISSGDILAREYGEQKQTIEYLYEGTR